MAHISLPEGAPGIRGLMAAYPETQVHLSGLPEALLRGPSSLTPGEREKIAAYVSRGNKCRYCCETHAVAARVHLGEQRGAVDQVLADAASAPVAPKMKAFHQSGLVRQLIADDGIAKQNGLTAWNSLGSPLCLFLCAAHVVSMARIRGPIKLSSLTIQPCPLIATWPRQQPRLESPPVGCSQVKDRSLGDAHAVVPVQFFSQVSGRCGLAERTEL